MKEREKKRSAKRPPSRLKFRIFLTVVELLSLEGDDGRPWPRSRGRRRTASVTAVKRLEHVAKTVIERLRGGLRLDLSEPPGYVERLFILSPAILRGSGWVWWLRSFFSLQQGGETSRLLHQSEQCMARRLVQASMYIYVTMRS